MTVVSDAAAASERRQKADAILMSLSLLDSGARGLRVEERIGWNENSVKSLGEPRRSARLYLQSIV